MKFKGLLVLVVLLVLGTIIGLALPQIRELFINRAAGTGSLSLPASINATSGTEFQVPVTLATGGTAVRGVDTVMTFDATKLTVTGILPTAQASTSFKTFVPVDANNNFDVTTVMNNANATGKIEFGAVTYDFAANQAAPTYGLTAAYNGTTILATVKFTPKAVSSTTNTTIAFTFDPANASTVDSNIVDDSPISQTAPYLNDILGSVSPTSGLPVTIAPAASGTQGPYGGTAWAIPGKIEAENYDTGGEGVAYHDLDAANQGGQYRTSEGVDVESTGDVGGGYDVGYFQTGEWMEYSVNVVTSGTYNLALRLANAATGANGATMHVEVDGVNKSGTIAVPGTGGWQTYQDVVVNNISLTSGAHIVKVAVDTPSTGTGYAANFNYMNWTAASTTPTLSGVTFSMQGITTSGVNKSITVYLRSGTTLFPFNATATSGNGGVFSVATPINLTGVAAGTYDVLVKDTSHLRKKLGTMAIVAGGNTAPSAWGTVVVKAGDFNNDGVLNDIDVGNLLTQYSALSVPVNANNGIYDVDSNGVINIFDISLVLANYVSLSVSGD